MTKDNVTIHVDAVAFFRINEAFKALCNIEDGEAAQTSVRDQLSTAAFDEVLHDREEAGRAVLAALRKLTDNWGVVIDAVKLKNIYIDESMIRTMGRRAEAERMRESRIIEADAELQVLKKLFQAGIELGDGALGLRWRELQTFTQIAAERNAMVIPANFDPGVVHAMRHLGRQQRMKLNQGADEK
ncbi:hypothetical protein ABVK25_004564 [Lepraria finkii]|uniref:Band 7 domain-containing protein n=1 Tax=Lepraria finkii TaxID=1340010 RepID=A0ABR4BBJ5_9LECA